MVSFWIIWTVLFIMVSMAASYNAKLNRDLSRLLPWLFKVLIPALYDVNKVTEVLTIKNKRIPVLQEWYRGSLSYGLCVYILQILMLVIAASMTFWSVVPYILVVVSTILLIATLVFALRTRQRHKDVEDFQALYFMVYAKLSVEPGVNETENNDNNSSSGASPHG